VLIRHCMSPNVTVIPAGLTCLEAWRTFNKESLRRAPVVDSKGGVIGMITDRDLMRVLPWTVADLESEESSRDPTRPVGDVARRELMHVGPDDHLEDAAQLLLEHRIGGLPVLENGRLVGIITESDIFRVFVGSRLSADTTRLTLRWQEKGDLPIDPSRVALACSVQLREFWRHEGPDGQTTIDLRVAGSGVDMFQERLVAAGLLLLDRRSPPKEAGNP
jgi:acetoin utilization protein AcuB